MSFSPNSEMIRNGLLLLAKENAKFTKLAPWVRYFNFIVTEIGEIYPRLNDSSLAPFLGAEITQCLEEGLIILGQRPDIITQTIPMRLPKIYEENITNHSNLNFSNETRRQTGGESWVRRDVGQIPPESEKNTGAQLSGLETNEEIISKNDLDLDFSSSAITYPASNTSNKNLSLPTMEYHSEMSFEKFYIGSGNRLAVAAAREVVANPAADYYMLIFIYGDHDFGKTHLLQATAQALRQKYPHRQISMMSMAQIVAYCQDGNLDKIALFRSMWMNSDIVLIDDIQVIGYSPLLQREVGEMIENSHDRKRQLVFASQLAPTQIQDISMRLRKQMQYGPVIEIQQPSNSFRAHILQSRAQEMGLNLSSDVLTALSEMPINNIRQLHGLMSQLHTHVMLLNRPLDLPLVRQVLRDYGKQRIQHVTMDQIVDFLCDEFRLTRDEIMSRNRSRSIARPRQIGMYLAHTYTQASLEEIGRAFDGRDHSTVKHAVDRIRALADVDVSIRTIIERFSKKIEIVA